MLFLGSFLAGAAAFLLPVYYQGKWTVPFDVGIQWVKGRFPMGVELYTLLLLLYGAGMPWRRPGFPNPLVFVNFPVPVPFFSGGSPEHCWGLGYSSAGFPPFFRKSVSPA